VAVLFALSDEWHQSFVPGRFFSMVDLASDSVGVSLGIGLHEGLRVGWAAGPAEKEGDPR
jgi:VanZ family protein